MAGTTVYKGVSSVNFVKLLRGELNDPPFLQDGIATAGEVYKDRDSSMYYYCHTTTPSAQTTPVSTYFSDTPISIKRSEKRIRELDEEKAPLANPSLTGTPTAPTPATGDNSTKIATTAFVQNGFSTSSLSENGYQKLPSGLIMQWGQAISTGGPSQRTVTFPTRFPTACLNVVVGLMNGGWEGDNITYASYIYNSKTTTSFKYVLDAEVGTEGVTWFAIGY